MPRAKSSQKQPKAQREQKLTKRATPRVCSVSLCHQRVHVALACQLQLLNGFLPPPRVQNVSAQSNRMNRTEHACQPDRGATKQSYAAASVPCGPQSRSVTTSAILPPRNHQCHPAFTRPQISGYAKRQWREVCKRREKPARPLT